MADHVSTTCPKCGDGFSFDRCLQVWTDTHHRTARVSAETARRRMSESDAMSEEYWADVRCPCCGETRRYDWNGEPQPRLIR